MSTRFRSAVLFDIDGTLVDSNYLHVAAWGNAFSSLGYNIPAWRIHARIGMDSELLLADILGPDAALRGDAAKQLHSAEYRKSASLLRPLPGARALIGELAEHDSAVVLATSAPEDELALLRKVLDVDDFITGATNADDVRSAKPEPEIVLAALELSQCARDQVVFVGDTVWDMQAATSAGVRCIGVLSGGIGAAELRDSGAREVYDDAEDLRHNLGTSPIARLL